MSSSRVQIGRDRIRGRVQYPAWRQAMTEPLTLYEVGSAAPTSADASIVWNGSQPYGQNGEMGWWTMSGYSSGTWLPDVGGAHGAMVIGTGGHDAMGTELLRFNLSLDEPTFDWWQQPIYRTSDTGDCDIYYNTTEYATFDSVHNMDDGDWDAWVADGKSYPCGYHGWIYPRAVTREEVAAQTPKGFRFYSTCYIPPAATGTGAGALLKVASNQGPWSQGGRPVNGSGVSIPVADWYHADHVWSAGSGKAKQYVYAKSSASGEWSRLPIVEPDFTPSASSYVPRHAHYCAALNRVYVWVPMTGGFGYYYIALDDGLAGATVSAMIDPALGSTHALDEYAGLNLISLDGRNLAFCATLNSATSIMWYDLDDTPNQFVVGPLVGFNHVNFADERWVWVPSQRMIYIVGHSNAGANPITLQTIAVPDDITDAAEYVVSTKINLPGADVDSGSWMYGKVFYHPALHCIFVPQDRHPMLAFIPG